jgi:signal transduction histidine kinase
MDAARGKRIVLVTTAPRGARPVVADLRAGGHRVRAARSIQAAHELLAAKKADLVLCDADLIARRGPPPSSEDTDLRATMAGVAHDLGSLLNALAESVDELSQLASATPFVGRAEALTRGRRRILRIQEFLRDLLADVSNGGAPDLETADVDLEDIVERAAITVYSEACHKNQRLALNIDEATSRVRADPAKLKRALAILLCRAVQEAPVAGTVTLEAKREGSDCLITVSDSGEGASPEEIRRLFQPAESIDGTPKVETRLQLSLVQRLIGQHGGRVWVESRPGHGIGVFVSLPQPSDGRSVDLRNHV